jgi:hypothetical protein
MENLQFVLGDSK